MIKRKTTRGGHRKSNINYLIESLLNDDYSSIDASELAQIVKEEVETQGMLRKRLPSSFWNPSENSFWQLVIDMQNDRAHNVLNVEEGEDALVEAAVATLTNDMTPICNTRLIDRSWLRGRQAASAICWGDKAAGLIFISPDYDVRSGGFLTAEGEKMWDEGLLNELL